MQVPQGLSVVPRRIVLAVSCFGTGHSEEQLFKPVAYLNTRSNWPVSCVVLHGPGSKPERRLARFNACRHARVAAVCRSQVVVDTHKAVLPMTMSLP